MAINNILPLWMVILVLFGITMMAWARPQYQGDAEDSQERKFSARELFEAFMQARDHSKARSAVYDAEDKAVAKLENSLREEDEISVAKRCGGSFDYCNQWTLYYCCSSFYCNNRWGAGQCVCPNGLSLNYDKSACVSTG